MSDSPQPELPEEPSGSATEKQLSPPPIDVPIAPERPPDPAPHWSGAERYELGDELARGGMGVVYRAHDRALDREVGLKTLIDVPKDARVAARFREEARITGQLQHPNIPPVHDLGTLPDGRPFLAMKLIKGKTLAALLNGQPAPAEDRGRFLAIFEHIAQGVAYAHAHKVIHRDLKASNVMVGAFGEVQVMDWGLAKVLADAPAQVTGATDFQMSEVTEIRASRDDGDETRDGTKMGTPQYMPPEQARGDVTRIDTRSDVFSLGGVLCVILTGRPPYTDADSKALFRLAARAELTNAFDRLDECGAEANLIALCKKCLSSEPEERFRDAGEVAKAVADLRAEAERRAQDAERELVISEARAADLKRIERLNRWLVAAIFLLSIAMGLIIRIALKQFDFGHLVAAFWLIGLILVAVNKYYTPPKRNRT